LTLDSEPRLNSRRAAVNHFDGYLLLELGVRTFGQEYLSHPADTQGVQYAILSYAPFRHAKSMHPDAGEPQTSPSPRTHRQQVRRLKSRQRVIAKSGKTVIL